MNKLKQHNLKRASLFVIPSVVVFALILTYGSSLVSSLGVPSTGLHPNITVSSGQEGQSMTKLANYTTGIGLGKEVDKAGNSVWVKDNSHLMLTLYAENATNGTTISATATNISSEPVKVTRLNIVGAIVNDKGNSFTNILNSAVIGCTANYQFPNNIVTVFTNGTSVSHTVDQTVVCTNPAVSSTTTLAPRESITGKVTTPLNVGNEQITRIGITASYETVSGNTEYSMVMPYQTIK